LRRAKAVLMQIAHYAADDGTGAYPSIATLVRDTGLSESTVHRALRDAERSGELQVRPKRGARGANFYIVVIDKISSRTDHQRYRVYEDIAAGRIPTVCFGPRCLRIPALFLERAAAEALATTDSITGTDR
jgi:hypothetical protein